MKFHVFLLLTVVVLGLGFSTKLVGILRGFRTDVCNLGFGWRERSLFVRTVGKNLYAIDVCSQAANRIRTRDRSIRGRAVLMLLGSLGPGLGLQQKQVLVCFAIRTGMEVTSNGLNSSRSASSYMSTYKYSYALRQDWSSRTVRTVGNLSLFVWIDIMYSYWYALQRDRYL